MTHSNKSITVVPEFKEQQKSYIWRLKTTTKMERHITWNIITWWINDNNGEIVISGLVIMLLMLVTRRLQIAGTTVISLVSLMMKIGVKKK